MKRLLFLLLSGMLAACLNAAEAKRFRPWLAPDMYTPSYFHVNLFNSSASYRISYAGSVKLGPGVMPNGGQLRVGTPINITVNGIMNTLLHMPEKNFSIFEEKGRAGCRMFLNFDGAAIHVEFFMLDSSPLLHCRITPAEKQLRPIRSIRISLDLLTSGLGIDPATKRFKPVGIYNREAKISGGKRLAMDRKWQQLPAGNSSVTVYDLKSEYNGSGPIFIGYHGDSLLSAKLKLDNCYMNLLEFELKKDFREFEFVLYKTRRKVSNNDFFALERQYAFPGL